MMTIKKLAIYLIVVLTFAFTNCARYKNILYFQDTFEKPDTSVRIITVDPELTVLKAGDNLYLNAYGVELGQLESFRKESSSTSNFSELSLYMQGYLIDENGFIEFPVAGKIQVAGLTLAEAQKKVQKMMDEYLVGVVVDLRLLSYEVTILGEVRRPGNVVFYKTEVTILEALSKAGDIGDYADARHVLILRKSSKGTESIELDITSSNAFQSPGFWVMPGDIIYVKPHRSKMWSINSPSISLVLSGLTTMLLLLTYINF